MKKNIAALIILVAVMFGLPWGAVTFAPGDAAMAICFVLFFGVNSLCSLYAGIFAGLSVKQRFWLPPANSLIFLLGVWTVFDWGNSDFYSYAIAYLAVSMLAMVITVFVVRNIKKELNQTEYSF